MKSQTIVDSLNVNPNPFQNRTSCTYSFINNDTVSINIYDVIGNIIYSPITNSVMPSGIYQDSLIMDAYPNGVYFAQLKLSSRKTINQKIIKSNTANVKQNYTTFEGIEIYPNPVIDKLNINFSETGNNKIAIYNVISQVIFVTENSREIDFSNFESGIYYLQVRNENNFNVFKIIKN